MRNVNQLKGGIFLSYLNLILGNVVPLLYTPIMLRILGQEEYGLYSLATSVTSYLSLMSLGIGTAVVRYLISFKAKGDTEGESKMLGLFSCIFFVIAFLTLIAGCIIAANIELIYGNTLSSTELGKIKLLTVLMSINSAVAFAFSVFGSVIIAHEKFIFQQVLNICGTVIPPIVNLIFLYLGFSSVGLAISSLCTSIVTYIVQTIYCLTRVKIKPIYHDMPIHLLKEVFAFSFFVFISNVVSTLHSATDKVIIGAYIGTVAVAIYNVGVVFQHIVQQISRSISSFMIPRVTTMVDSNARDDELTDFLIKIGRIQMIIIGLIVGGFCAFGREFVYLYAGESYKESYLVAVLLMIPSVVPMIQNVAINIALAKNKHQFRSMVTLFTAILNVFATIWLVQIWGIIGAAITTCACNFIGSIGLMNWYYYKKVGLNIPLFWKNILPLATIPFILSLFTLFIGNYIDFTHPIVFLGGVVVYTVLYLILIYPKLNDYEKKLFKKTINRNSC